jgi:hypothetical protein
VIAASVVRGLTASLCATAIVYALTRMLYKTGVEIIVDPRFKLELYLARQDDLGPGGKA